MPSLYEIQKKVMHDQFEFSRHAVDQSIIRNISVQELKQAINTEAKIIEDYPNDKYGPSCLILGYTKQKRLLHIQCSYPSRTVLKIVTLYEPDPDKWINFEKRRNP
ncbi:MAG: DUF4258 domain-containing protein [Balneolaceae bacterium]|nr:DUF4258 domain-containing protein [Balneolaceae bacterium]